MPTTIHNVWGEDLDLPLPDGTEVTVKAGESIEVEDDDFAGRSPSGTPGTKSYDPGSGLLAQEAKWRSARSVSAEKAAKTTKKES